MANLNLVGDENAATHASFEGIRKQRGLMPNLLRVLGIAPARLHGYLGLSGTLGGGMLPAALREGIALLSAGTNGCDHCLLAYSMIGAGAGLSAVAVGTARTGKAETVKDKTALSLPRAVLARQDRGAEAEPAPAPARDDAAIIEIVLNVAMSLQTNRINTPAGAPTDFAVRHTGH
ncbi:hypothetical protein [Dankookia sp. P2]|uniref:hypothetical protein n=1 Tax=Dankookia sp. P2 TaxID=3423955 RepID=UPI003D6652E5